MGQPSERRGSYASLIGLTLAGSKRHKGDELPLNGPRCLCEHLFSTLTLYLGHVATILISGHFVPK